MRIWQVDVAGTICPALSISSSFYPSVPKPPYRGQTDTLLLNHARIGPAKHQKVARNRELKHMSRMRCILKENEIEG
jgi:hypothetical protein